MAPHNIDNATIRNKLEQRREPYRDAPVARQIGTSLEMVSKTYGHLALR